MKKDGFVSTKAARGQRPGRAVTRKQTELVYRDARRALDTSDLASHDLNAEIKELNKDIALAQRQARATVAKSDTERKQLEHYEVRLADFEQRVAVVQERLDLIEIEQRVAVLEAQLGLE